MRKVVVSNRVRPRSSLPFFLLAFAGLAAFALRLQALDTLSRSRRAPSSPKRAALPGWKSIGRTVRRYLFGRRTPFPSSSSSTPTAAPPRRPRPPPELVPSIVHFIFGLDPTFGHLGFSMIHYLAVLGAAMHLRPRGGILFHHKYEPSGPWWECARPLLTLTHVENVTEVHGRRFDKMKVQHQADIIRMRLMREVGGIYLDADVIPLRPFDELLKYNLSMGQEGGEGLCNAVMVGAPNTSFVNRWWDEYRHFDPTTQWAYHSVILPRELSRRHPGEVQILGERAFFYPMWTQLRAMYDVDDGYDYKDNFAVHLWTSIDERQRGRLGRLTPADIFAGNGSFHRIARKFLVDARASGKLCKFAEF